MDKELLFKPRLPEADVEVPGIGTVRVRGLSRAEVMAIQKSPDLENIDGPRMLAIERKMVAAGMVDPELTEAEVGQWQKASAFDELNDVHMRIQELSGMQEGATKSGLPGDGVGPGAGVHVLSGEQAGDDGGPAADGDG